MPASTAPGPKSLPKVGSGPAHGADDGRISTTFAGEPLRVTRSQGAMLLHIMDTIGEPVPAELRLLLR